MKPASTAVFIRIFHRWSGLLLILFTGLKILSGFVIAGRIQLFGASAGYRIHYAAWIDVPLLFLFIMHAMYGLLKIVQGRITSKTAAFAVASISGVLLFLISLIFIYFI
ncbi:hypothetical protein JW948_17555 [bacterium]|nr:hypothetical protein [bacterium]